MESYCHLGGLGYSLNKRKKPRDILNYTQIDTFIKQNPTRIKKHNKSFNAVTRNNTSEVRFLSVYLMFFKFKLLVYPTLINCFMHRLEQTL